MPTFLFYFAMIRVYKKGKKEEEIHKLQWKDMWTQAPHIFPLFLVQFIASQMGTTEYRSLWSKPAYILKQTDR